MADLARAEELVQAMDRDDTFRTEVEAAPTVAAKRRLLDERGFEDVGLADMKAYVESKGGKLVVPAGGRELSDEDLAAVAGGLTAEEAGIVGGALAGMIVLGVAASAAS